MKSSKQSSSRNVVKAKGRKRASLPPISIDVSMTQTVGKEANVHAKVQTQALHKNALIRKNIRDQESHKLRKRTVSSVRKFKPRNEFSLQSSVTTTPVPHNSLETPISPETPNAHCKWKTLSDFEHELNKKLGKYDDINTIRDNGYIPCKRFTSTLQGSLWRAQKDGQSAVIKVTKKALHEKHVALVDNMQVNVCEDILRETAVLHYLTDHNPPKALTTFENFFQDKLYYFIVMEDGGVDFFKFISQCHIFIDEGVIAMSEWHRFCKKAMLQLVELIDWMHNTMHCCHLDISLENLLISDVMVIGSNDSPQVTFSDDFQMKLCDFGLAEVFAVSKESMSVDFMCAKYVGKRPYKAPQVYAKKELFDARKADVWSFGVVMFMMIVGGQPWLVANDKDRTYKAIVTNGKMLDVLHDWDRLDYVTADIIDLFQKIFKKSENERLNIQKIKKHPFFRSQSQS